MPGAAPLLGWSEARIRDVRNLAQHPDPFASALGKCKLAVIEGDLQSAGGIAEEIFSRYGAEVGERRYLEHITMTSLIARRNDIAEQMIIRRMGGGPHVKLNLEPPRRGWGGILRWSVASRDSMEFHINEEIFHSDQTEFYLARWIHLIPLYKVYSQYDDIEAGSVYLSLDDRAGPPGLAFCELRPEYFLIPDNSFVLWRSYQAEREHYAQNDIAWEHRKPVALWRGSTTGFAKDRRNGWRSLQRVRLCEIGLEHPDLLDAGITSIVQFAEQSVVDEIRNSGLIREYVPATEFNKYKYQIDIDGNTNSWPGLFTKLLTGSPVIKIASPFGFRQW